MNLLNDLAFVFAFFLARIVFGTMNVSSWHGVRRLVVCEADRLGGGLGTQSVTFFKSIVQERDRIPLWLFCTVSVRADVCKGRLQRLTLLMSHWGTPSPQYGAGNIALNCLNWSVL